MTRNGGVGFNGNGGGLANSSGLVNNSGPLNTSGRYGPVDFPLTPDKGNQAHIDHVNNAIYFFPRSFLSPTLALFWLISLKKEN